MRLLELLENMLGSDAAALILNNVDSISEIRLRSERPFQIVCTDGRQYMGDAVRAQTLERIVSRLMDDSLYSREAELQHGYFTTSDGCRVGVCGKTAGTSGRIECFSNIGSVCIRIPREAKGCADKLFKDVFHDGLKNLLLISPPGMGKTTMLRELARLISDNGYNVAISDERREIAACVEGVPQMDVGCRTDVMDGCAKAIAIPLLVRACAPDVLVADEIGAGEDAKALLDAVRCGVRIIATAHGFGIEEAEKRRNIAPLFQAGAFDYCALLGPRPGGIKYLRRCADGVLNDAEGNFAFNRTAELCGNRPRNIQCAQKAD